MEVAVHPALAGTAGTGLFRNPVLHHDKSSAGGKTPGERENTMSAYKLPLRQRSGESGGEGAATRRCVAGAGSEPRALAWLLRRGLSSFTLAAALVVLAVMTAHAADLADGDLRLRAGASHNEGRLEIYHENEWGTVCDDFFDRIDAKVACK